MQRPHEPKHATGVVERPAAQNAKPFGLGMVRREFIGQNGEAEERIALQLLREVKPILTQAPGTWGKGCNQTDFHSSPVP